MFFQVLQDLEQGSQLLCRHIHSDKSRSETRFIFINKLKKSKFKLKIIKIKILKN